MTESTATFSISDLPGLVSATRAHDDAVAVAAFRALVLVPLDPAGWAHVTQLTLDLLSRLPGLDQNHRGDVIAAAAYVPTRPVRDRLRRLAHDVDADWPASVPMPEFSMYGPVQLAAAYALCRRRDGSAGGVMKDLAQRLEDPGARAAAIHGLAMLDYSAASAWLRAVAGDRDEWGEVRLFAAVAFARGGDLDVLRNVGHAFHDDELRMEYQGDPLVLDAQLEALAPLAPEVADLLQARIDDAELDPFIESVVQTLVWASRDEATAESEREPVTTTDTGGDREAAAIGAASAVLEHLRRHGETDRLETVDSGALHERASVLADLPSATATGFVTELFALSRGDEGWTFTVGNWLVSELVPDLRAPFVPDVAALFEMSGDAHDQQVAWTMSRSGIGKVLAALSPIAGDVADPSRSMHASRLIELAISLAGHRFGPQFGGGGEASPLAPPTQVIDLPGQSTTMHSPAAGVAAPAEPEPPQPQPFPALEHASPTPAPAGPFPWDEKRRRQADQNADWGPPRTRGAFPNLFDRLLRRYRQEPSGPRVEKDGGTEGSDRGADVDRFVQAMIMHRRSPRKTFVSGAVHTVRVWIGAHDEQDHRPRGRADEPVPRTQIPPEGLELDVLLSWRGETAKGRLVLPPGADARSGDCDLELRVPEGERFVSADLVFLYRGRIFEYTRLEARVVQPGELETETDRIDIEVELRRRQVVDLANRETFDAAAIQQDDHLLVFGPQGVGDYSFDELDPVVDWLNARIFATERSLVRRAAASDASEPSPRLDVSDDETRKLLIELARQGNLLYKDLSGQNFEDPGPRMQLLNRDPKRYVPLEFLYDRGYTTDDATVSPECLQALAADVDVCPHCGPANQLKTEVRNNNKLLCPFGFWSLQKVIERHDQHPGDSDDDESSPRNTSRTISVPESVLYGWSDQVRSEQQSELRQTIQQTFDRASRWQATSWELWQQSVSHRPDLLVALPHHEVSAGCDHLDLGAGSQLDLGRELELYVRSPHARAGPIMILLGCETDRRATLGYTSFARAFSQSGASVVIGTLSKVIGRHAVPVAQRLVTELAAIDDADTDLGHLLRRLRRQMFADGYLMALALVALGDADWHLTPGAMR